MLDDFTYTHVQPIDDDDCRDCGLPNFRIKWLQCSEFIKRFHYQKRRRRQAFALPETAATMGVCTTPKTATTTCVCTIKNGDNDGRLHYQKRRPRQAVALPKTAATTGVCTTKNGDDDKLLHYQKRRRRPVFILLTVATMTGKYADSRRLIIKLRTKFFFSVISDRFLLMRSECR